jgi:hypothetical protein
MRLIFPESQLIKMRHSLRANPDATGVELTSAELVDIYDELLANEDSNCVLISGHREFHIDGRKIKIEVIKSNAVYLIT